MTQSCKGHSGGGEKASNCPLKHFLLLSPSPFLSIAVSWNCEAQRPCCPQTRCRHCIIVPMPSPLGNLYSSEPSFPPERITYSVSHRKVWKDSCFFRKASVPTLLCLWEPSLLYFAYAKTLAITPSFPLYFSVTSGSC